MKRQNAKKKQRENWKHLHSEGRHEFAKRRNAKREAVKAEKLKRKKGRQKNLINPTK